MKKRRTPRLIRIPVTRVLRDEFAMMLYTSVACLESSPTAAAYNNLAGIMNVVQIALENDRRHQHEARLINGAASAMNQAAGKAEAGMPLAEHELAAIRVGVSTVDGLLGRLDVSALYVATQQLRAMRQAAAPTSTQEPS